VGSCAPPSAATAIPSAFTQRYPSRHSLVALQLLRQRPGVPANAPEHVPPSPQSVLVRQLRELTSRCNHGWPYCGVSSIAQKPAMHMLGSWPFAGGQQSASIVQRSFVFEQRIGSSSQVPIGSANSTCGSFTKQNPPQQSVPEVQLPPVFLQGSSAANARWLPVPNSWPGK
jgi:hypothetical protein